MKSLFALFICVACLAGCQKHELVPVPGTTDVKPEKGALVPMPVAPKEDRTYTPLNIPRAKN